MRAFIGKDGGFSLAELLVALVVAMVLIIGVASGYIVNKRSYEEETGIRDMQMNAQVAMAAVKELIMSAGLGSNDNFPPLGTDTLQGAFRSASRVLTATNRADGPDTVMVVTARRPLPKATAVCDCQNQEPPTCQYCEGNLIDIVEAGDFDTGLRRYIFFGPSVDNRYLTVSALSGSQVTLSEPLRWNNGDQVFRVSAFTITLDRTPDGSRIDVDGDGKTSDGDGDDIPDLYICDNTADLEQEADCKVAQGIEDIQFQYCTACRDANDDGTIDEDQWVDDPAGSEDDVRAVRIWILAKTLLPDSGHTEQTDSIAVADHTIDLSSSSDPLAVHFHRYLLVDTVLIRNRTF
jgi:hypothetical protein